MPPDAARYIRLKPSLKPLWFKQYIERREELFHGRDNNRKSFAFEWGDDHLREYVAKALEDSAAFYSYEPTSEYQFDGEIL